MQTPQCLLVIYRNYLWLSRFQVWHTQLCKLCTMKMIASGAPWMFSMSLSSSFYRPSIKSSSHLFSRPTWMAATAFSWSAESRRTPSTSTIRSLVLKPPALLFQQRCNGGEKKCLDFLKRLIILVMTLMMVVMLVMTIVTTVGTCQQDCPEEHSWWRCPSHFAAEDPPINDDLDEKSNSDQNYDSNDKERVGKD